MKPALALLLALVVSPQVLRSQSTVSGRLAFRPGLATDLSIDAVVEVLDGATVVHAEAVDSDSPFHFTFAIDDPAAVSRPLHIRVVVREPPGYLTEQPEYQKQVCCNFVQDIRVRRQQDVYHTALTRGSDPAQPVDKQLKYLTYATKAAETNPQKLEATRQLAQGYQRADDDENRAKVLGAANAKGTLEGAGPNRAKTYWSERLDALLDWGEYGNGAIPAKTFATKVVAPDNRDLGDAWVSFATEFEHAYPQAAIPLAGKSSEAVEAQLRAINQTLGRSPGT